MGPPPPFSLLRAGEADPARLKTFLRRFYPVAKTAFLLRHGDWWHRGTGNRLVLAAPDGGIAAYCAVVPGRCRVEGRAREALWWIDLVVAPEHRGRGLQSFFDREVRHRGELLLGFPNALAAAIHRKHGWGVREDLTVLLLPLHPPALGRVRRARGAAGLAVRAAARLGAPAAALLRRRLAGRAPGTAREVAAPEAGELAQIFSRFAESSLPTLERDADHLRWRYLDAPYRDQLRFYLAGPAAAPSHALIARWLPVDGGTAVRVLDLFGDLSDLRGLTEVLGLLGRQAAREGAVQVTALASCEPARRAARAAGFLAAGRARFCWHTADADLHRALARGHWVLGDSDNDEPA